MAIILSQFQKAGQQTELFEAGLYHQNTGTFGFFSVLVSDQNGTKVQRSYPLPELVTVLKLLPCDRDSYLSQAEFLKPNRRVVNLARLGLLFVDIDCYKFGYSPEQASSMLLDHCDVRGIPLPSIIIHSGRGLYAKWLLDEALPRQALPRWNRAQSELVSAFTGIGADQSAKDASRVLRVVGTVNTKNGETVKITHVTYGHDGEPIRYGFDYLCEWLLPFSREQLDKMRQDRAEVREKRQYNASLRLASSSERVKGLRAFSGRQLAWHRLEDLRTLIALRNGVAEGSRMVTMFWLINFLLSSGATNSDKMFLEARALAREIGFGEMQEDELSTLYAKAKSHEAGEFVDFNGHRYTPLYTPKNDTLINIFNISDEEQRSLRTIISSDMAAERHSKREESRRRAAGAVAREDYLEAAKTKKFQAMLLKEQGLSVRSIAAQMGVSVGSVAGYLNADRT